MATECREGPLPARRVTLTHGPTTSGLPPEADLGWTSRHVRKEGRHGVSFDHLTAEPSLGANENYFESLFDDYLVVDAS